MTRDKEHTVSASRHSPQSRQFYVALETRGHRFFYVFTPDDTPELLETVLADAERDDLVLDWQDVRDVLEAVDAVIREEAMPERR